MNGQQPRERAVPCVYCRRETWNTSAVCDLCALRRLTGEENPSD